MIYLILAVIILILISILLFKMLLKTKKENKELSWKLDNYSDVIKVNSEIEKDKTDIRNKYNEQETNISNSDTPVDSVMPIGKVRKHNHKFNQPCGKDYPVNN